MGYWKVAAAAIGAGIVVSGIYLALSTGNIFLAFVAITIGILFLMAAR